MARLVIGRINRGGKHFEVLLHPDGAYLFLEGKSVNVEDVLGIEKVFRDANKGIEASSGELMEAFGTDEAHEVCKHILTDGEVQLTTEYVRKLQERKRKWIANYIHRNYVDPRTNLPHPSQRIERAMKEAKIKVDPFKRPEEQVGRIVEQIRRHLPLKGGTAELVVKIPAAMWGKAKAMLSGQGKVLREKMTEDGLAAEITAEVPVRSHSLVLERVGKMGGSVEVTRT